eukprot:gene1818-1848_t
MWITDLPSAGMKALLWNYSVIIAKWLKRLAQFQKQPTHGTVVDFSSVKRQRSAGMANRFSIVDRMTADSWTEAARKLGYTRMVFEPAAQIDGLPSGEFLLIYAQDCAWSTWGVGCDDDGLTLWHAPRGKTIGRFPTMHEALEQIAAITLGG